MAKTKTATPKNDDPFAALVGETKAVEKKKSGKKKDRAVLELNDDEAQAFNRFCMADATLKMAEGHQQASKGTILPVLTDKLLNMWCEEGHRTDNPVITTDSGRAILQAREKLSFELPVDENGNTGSTTELLQSVGFSENEAAEIAQREFSEKVELRFSNITKLRDEPKGKKVVDKLLKFVLENYNAEERGMLLEKVNHVTLNEGFLDRAVGHVNRDPVRLKALFTAVKPQFLMSHIVYNGEIADAVKTLTGEAPKEIKGSIATPTVAAPKNSIPTEVFSDDKQWKAVANGNEVTLFMIQGGREFNQGKKVCSGGVPHAQQTAKKLCRDPEYRATFLEAQKK
jgi:hypothetical protein